jgi:hypothetical protein
MSAVDDAVTGAAAPQVAMPATSETIWQAIRRQGTRHTGT